MDLGPRVGVVPQASCHLARAQVIVSRRIRFLVYNSVFCFKTIDAHCEPELVSLPRQLSSMTVMGRFGLEIPLNYRRR